MNWLKTLWAKILAWFGAQPDEPDTPDTPEQPTVPTPKTLEAGGVTDAPDSDTCKEERYNIVPGMQTAVLARRRDYWIKRKLWRDAIHVTQVGEDVYVTADDFKSDTTVYKYEMVYVGTSAESNWRTTNPVKLTKQDRHDVLRVWYVEHKPK